MSKRASKRSTAAGRKIIAGLSELVDMAKKNKDLSGRFTIRKVELPDDPKTYDVLAIRATRGLLGASKTLGPLA
jgi:hypothetical protein